jgi:hypothetical protein
LVSSKTDWQVRRDIRDFVWGFDGGWRWSLRRPSANCRSFQLALLTAVGLREPPGELASRGRGCPFLRPFRWARCTARRASHGRVPQHRLGGRCGCAPVRVPPLAPQMGARPGGSDPPWPAELTHHYSRQ